MTTDLKLREKRRGERVLIRVPVHLQAVGEDDSKIIEPSETVVVSHFGALLRTTSRLKNGSSLSVTNGFTQETEKFHVVWVADKQTEGRWDTGVESDNPREDFWGIRFPPKDTKEKVGKA